MIRQVRIGLTLLLAGVLAIIAFTHAAGGLRWTSERASSRSSAPSDVLVTTPIDQQAVLAPSPPTTAQIPNIEKTHAIFADWVHPLTAHPQMEHKLQDGQAVKVPTASKATSMSVSTGGPLTYTVMPGDTLWAISMEYGVSVTTLEQTNQIAGSALYVGEKLTIEAPMANYTPTQASLSLIQHAPPSLMPVYQAAGKKYDIPWTVLAAIHKEETDFDCTGQDVSSAGALGPMQFMPSTFAIYGVAAPGHTVPNIHNVDDAIYSTAHMLAAQGFDRDPYHAIYDYNHSVSYVDDILRMSAV
ncbi:lytic murein transglycosylase [Alicyclobacillus fastidiosus]|uniref:Lytic murein transglycosylase n=1 Tax=Alicyclobacillus fastidiosus TaxID=392011 RepID=A0ABY6ZC20_9BACL|nr:lytic murein transglycosylase [Alicyclobacillus fastidiosus]WAH39650.1 lytic murein transglycosylase [Alicyclobacillus fastidiosus]GMA60858.1 hypothetical protein GCM10025859_12980 [Alicyclobacillus fastidiosus]